MRVGLVHVATPLEDLRVPAVAVEEPLIGADRGELRDRQLELVVTGLRVPGLVSREPEPDVRLGDVWPLFEPLGQVQRLQRQVARLGRPALGKVELGEAQQHVGAAELHLGLVEQLDRAVEVLAGMCGVTPGEQDEPEVVLHPREVPLVAKHFEQRDRPVGEADGLLDLSDLSIGAAKARVRQGQLAQVVDAVRDMDGLRVGGDREIPFLVHHAAVAEHSEQPQLGHARDGLDASAYLERPLCDLHRARLLGQEHRTRLRRQTLGEHQPVVGGLEMGVCLLQQDRRLLGPREIEQREREVIAKAAEHVG